MPNHFGNADDIILEEYNQRYPQLFLDVKAELENLLGNAIVSVHHIGSTAVEGIRSKPVIDIAIETDSFPLSAGQIKILTGRWRIFWCENPECETHKIQLAESHSGDREKYTEMKSDFVASVLTHIKAIP